MASKDNIYCDSEKRIIYFSSDVDNSSIGMACYDILFINEMDDLEEETKKNYERKPIKVYINSGGGDVYDMWSLIDIMLSLGCHTGTNFDGGGSIALLYKDKNSQSIETIVGNKRALTEVGYFTE